MDVAQFLSGSVKTSPSGSWSSAAATRSRFDRISASDPAIRSSAESKRAKTDSVSTGAAASDDGGGSVWYRNLRLLISAVTKYGERCSRVWRRRQSGVASPRLRALAVLRRCCIPREDFRNFCLRAANTSPKHRVPFRALATSTRALATPDASASLSSGRPSGYAKRKKSSTAQEFACQTKSNR